MEWFISLACFLPVRSIRVILINLPAANLQTIVLHRTS